MAKRLEKRNWIELVLWTLLFLSSFAFYSRMTHWTKAFGIALTFLAVYYSLAFLNRKVLIPKLFNQSKYLAYAGSVIILLVLVANLTVRLDYLSVFDIKLELHTKDRNAKLPVLSRSSERVKSTFILVMAFGIMFLTLIYQLTVDYLKRQQQQLELEREKAHAELSYLKAQMHPHFFLNALNGLYALARLSPQKTGVYITKLGEMLTYLTYETNKAEVLLTQEVKYLKNYIYFQEYKDDIFEITLVEEIENPRYNIEPFLLIPFVENAFKHGYNGETSTPIHICIQQKGPQLIFECENPMANKALNREKEPTNGIGIDNVTKRLQLKYPNQFKLVYGQEKDDYKVFLKITTNG